jgi:AmpD protein
VSTLEITMRIDLTSGWLEPARRVPSPNCDARPPGTGIDLLIIHGISLPPGEFGGEWIDALFTNTLAGEAHPYFAGIRQLRVSAHLLIDRHGVVTQFVPFHLRAWHAGESSFHGRTQCNDFSIGVELEGTDTVPYEDAQYTAVSAVTRALMDAYPGITLDRITGHSDVAPGRKTDPGPAFDWGRFRALLEGRRLT